MAAVFIRGRHGGRPYFFIAARCRSHYLFVKIEKELLRWLNNSGSGFQPRRLHGQDLTSFETSFVFWSLRKQVNLILFARSAGQGSSE